MDLPSLVISVAIVLVLAAVARRILGVSAGWTRVVVFALAVIGLSQPAFIFVGTRAGVFSDGRLVGSPFVAMAFATLTATWIFTIGLAGLVIAEAVLPTGALPGPATLWRMGRDQLRRARRYAAIMAIAARHGLGRFTRRGAPSVSGAGGLERTAEALRQALEEGGVAFVKLGQMLSTRSDLLPEAVVGELSKLHADAKAAPWHVIEQAIVQGLGRPTTEVFQSIEREPLAAASVGQVHTARLLNGSEVVVKVQRPDARRQITADLDIILRLARRLDRHTAWGRAVGIQRLAEGFAASLREELDYTVEMDNISAVRQSLGDGDPVRLPTTFPELSTPTVLVMERLDGTPVSTAARPDGALAGYTSAERRQLAEGALAVVMRQILVTGVFHADLHPGNLLVRTDHTIGLLDFGSVGRLDRTSRTALGLLIAAVDRDDPAAATNSLVELLGRPTGLDQQGLEREVGELIVRYSSGTARLDAFTALLRLVVSYRFTVPPQVAAAFRAIGALEGTLRAIAPDFDLITAARRVSGDLMRTAFDRDTLQSMVVSQLASMLPTLQRLPHRINTVVEDLEQGRTTINVRSLADHHDRQFLTKIGQQLMTTVLAAAATIGAILLMTAETGPMLTSTVTLYSFIGYILLFIGFVLGLRVLAPIFFGSRRQ